MLSDSVDLNVDVKEDYNEPLYIVEIYNLFGEKLSENMKSLVTNVDTMTIQVMAEIDNEYLITLIEKNKSNNVLRNLISASPYRIYFQPLKDSSKQINILPKMLVDGSDLFNLQGVNKSLKSLLYNSPIKKYIRK